jgi:hypothetical protein
LTLAGALGGYALVRSLSPRRAPSAHQVLNQHLDHLLFFVARRGVQTDEHSLPIVQIL